MEFIVLLLSIIIFSDLEVQGQQAEGFTVVPSTQQVSVGELAVFKCQHPNGFIGWMLNGTSLVAGSLPNDISFGLETKSDGTIVDLLRIVAHLEYNGSEVVCIAFLDNLDSESTLPVILEVVSISNTPPTIEFEGFTLLPMPLNVSVEETAIFHCNHISADVIGWRVNGIPLGSNGLQGINLEINSGVPTLKISAIPAYNNSLIKCIATFINGKLPELAPTVMLTIQGPLDSVSNITANVNHTTEELLLMWTPPYSLNLTDVEPDIAYCVDIYNITCKSRNILFSNCSIITSELVVNLVNASQYIFEIIVTPRSNTESARNGTSNAVKDRFTSLLIKNLELQTVGPDRHHVRLTLYFHFNANDITPIQPSNYVLQLESEDMLEPDKLLTTTMLTRGDEAIILQVTEPLQHRRLWNMIVLAYGCSENAVTSIMELSTHDIQNVSAYLFPTNEIYLFAHFINGSTGSGILLIIYSLYDGFDVHYIEILRATDELNIKALLNDLNNGYLYNISVFVIDDGLPVNRTATIPTILSTSDVGTMEQSESDTRIINSVTNKRIQYKIFNVTSTGVCITCMFPKDSSTADCVAVVHRRISQLSSGGLTNIESSHSLTRYGDTAHGCIIVSLDDYQIGIIGAKQSSINEGDIEVPDCGKLCYVATATVLGMIFLTVITIIFIIFLWNYNRKKQTRDNQVDAVMVIVANEAYACPTKINRAYGTRGEVLRRTNSQLANVKLQYTCNEPVTTITPYYEEIQNTVHTQ